MAPASAKRGTVTATIWRAVRVRSRVEPMRLPASFSSSRPPAHGGATVSATSVRPDVAVPDAAVAAAPGAVPGAVVRAWQVARTPSTATPCTALTSKVTSSGVPANSGSVPVQGRPTRPARRRRRARGGGRAAQERGQVGAQGLGGGAAEQARGAVAPSGDGAAGVEQDGRRVEGVG
ncbi:hypothetical protein BJF79_03275 [Actinomadura sp. CNU-125]|nr:hypothetical protein BJF79_03275 [Actinomadura sp. CNU-125]